MSKNKARVTENKASKYEYLKPLTREALGHNEYVVKYFDG